MQPSVVLQILGRLLCIFSTTMIPPAVVGYLYQDEGVRTFLLSFCILLVAGGLMIWRAGNQEAQLKLRDGYLIVVLFWSVLGLAGAVPLMLSESPSLTVYQAIFESMSALTTTGATVIVGLDYLPRSILFYRQELQWLGGMGIIVLAIAILPALGIGGAGGMQLFKAETSGAQQGGKMTPRIAGTAKALWLIYLSLTAACGLAYYWAGMDGFDSIGHAFSTVAIGGFSTHDDSIGFFDSRAIEGVAIVFMFLSGINFGLHFLAWHNVFIFKNIWARLNIFSWSRVSARFDKRFSIYGEDAEFKTYTGFLVVVTLLVIIGLLISSDLGVSDAFFQGLFHTVSMATTTGFSTTEYYNWGGSLPFILLCASFVGGCAGSTGGGLKVVRVMMLVRQGQRELTRMVHPHAQVVVKVGRKRVSDRQIEVVWGFFSAYVAIFVLFMIILMTMGLDQVTAFSSLVACMNNLGPGLGEVASNYSAIEDGPLVLMCLAMLLGRLEIFTLLVLFTPAFWRK